MTRSAVTLGLGLLFVAAMLPAHAQQTFPKRLVGDYGYWSRTQTPPYGSAQIPFHKLTHINHAGVGFNADGSLSVPSGFLEPELISKGHAAGVKVMLLLGGDFVGLESTPGGLQTLLANLKTFITANGYDGLDIDWEYPSSTADTQLFYALMTRLRKTFPSPAYVLSADIPPWGGAYDIPGVLPSLDYINVMMYDCAGPWTDDGQLNSPIFPNPNNPQPWECEPGGSVAQTANIFLNDYHVPAAKLNMGTPFYGYFYTTVDQVYGLCWAGQPNRTCGGRQVVSVAYGTWVKPVQKQPEWTTYFDRKSMVPYMLRTDGSPGFVTYDDQYSTYMRIWYAEWQRGLGGGFMWSLDQDYDGHTQPLLDSMYQATMNMPYTGPTP
ncbi:MAG TPA: glycoside hydrolase family 18 protein [Bryobacteraceae bacterium]|nr:glycoside hydrolase family 18 protein [Bryobacteraceae bacterium]